MRVAIGLCFVLVGAAVLLGVRYNPYRYQLFIENYYFYVTIGAPGGVFYFDLARNTDRAWEGVEVIMWPPKYASVRKLDTLHKLYHRDGTRRAETV